MAISEDERRRLVASLEGALSHRLMLAVKGVSLANKAVGTKWQGIQRHAAETVVGSAFDLIENIRAWREETGYDYGEALKKFTG